MLKSTNKKILKQMEIAALITYIFNAAKISKFDVYGNPSEELKKLLASFGAEIYNLFAGFSR